MFSNRKLLLADDSTTIQKVIELTFGDEGLQVISVGDGEEAIRQLEQSPPDILLADVFMPGRTGYEVCEHVKRSERLRSIPVVLLVGTFEPFDEAEARRVGADDVLTKPFQSIRELVGKVGALLGNRSQNEKAANDEEEKTLISQPQVAANQERQSEAGTAFDERTSSGDSYRATAFADQGTADDGMIEVATAEEFDRGAASQPRPSPPFDSSDRAEADFAPPRELQQQELSSREQPHEAQANAFQSDREIYPAAPPQQFFGGAQVGDEMENIDFPPIESRMTHAERADEALLDLGDVATPAPAAEADDFILDLTDDNSSSSGAPAFSAARTPPSSANDYPAFEMPAPFVPQADHEAAVDYSSPQIDSVKEYSSESHDARSYSTQELDGKGVKERGGAAAETTGLAASRSGAAMNLNQLSPEVIDMIARRAVEHLSERVVREIAWEVVPQLAELIIKRRLDEENSSGM